MKTSEFIDFLKEKWTNLPKVGKWIVVLLLLSFIGAILPEQPEYEPQRNWDEECYNLYMQIVHAKDTKSINEAISMAKIILVEAPDSIKKNSGNYESLSIVMDSTQLTSHMEYARKKEAVSKLFYKNQGSCIPVTYCIKQSINDPDSYKHIATEYTLKDEWIDVICVFSAKNAFGGRVKAVAYAKMDYWGNILSFEIVE